LTGSLFCKSEFFRQRQEAAPVDDMGFVEGGWDIIRAFVIGNEI
jgi:hypothetical protein